LPQGVAARSVESREGADGGEAFQFVGVESCAPGEVFDRIEGTSCALLNHRRCGRRAQARYIVESQPDRTIFKRTNHVAPGHVHGQELHAVPLRGVD